MVLSRIGRKSCNVEGISTHEPGLTPTFLWKRSMHHDAHPINVPASTMDHAWPNQWKAPGRYLIFCFVERCFLHDWNLFKKYTTIHQNFLNMIQVHTALYNIIYIIYIVNRPPKSYEYNICMHRQRSDLQSSVSSLMLLPAFPRVQLVVQWGPNQSHLANRPRDSPGPKYQMSFSIMRKKHHNHTSW